MPLSVASISKRRARICVRGIVQGVGFRPFVYQLAQELSLGGFVLNGGDGVIIEAEGRPVSIDNFIDKLNSNPPPLARIDSFRCVDIEPQGDDEFIIQHSNRGKIKTMVSSDISMCSACKDEMNDPKNRRYKYPFINCTDCGPRYTIIENLPYDRVNTSMSVFSMCSKCKQEYEDPSNRRFHAQPVSCYDCGPSLYFLDLEGQINAKGEDAIEDTCRMIKEGKSVGIKGLGGFHIVCDANNEEAVRNLRKNKNRPTKPLAVMFKNIEKIKEVCLLTKADEEMILSKERPIVIVQKKRSGNLAYSIAPNISRIGVFLPYTPLHERVLDALDSPIVATSANLSDESIIVDEKSLIQKLSHVLSAVLSHDRKILNACDDSVCMISNNKTILMRMARGYAPLSISLKQKSLKKIMAVGANQKSTLALAFDDNLILSPHIGDLNSLDAFDYFQRTMQTFKRFYNFEPDIIVCDKHPNYETSKWAKEFAKENSNTVLLEVQHHYAHALACMAEHNLDEKVLAFCFDGTGYGDDNTLWGGEVLIADPVDYERIKHFRPIRLIGGEKAVREPNRIALSLLFEMYSFEDILNMDIECVKSFTNKELKTLYMMYEKGLNSPLSSSVGRLFDAVASLSGVSQKVAYEGESGILLECAAENSYTKDAFSYVKDENVIDYRPMIKELLQEKDKDAVALKFISMLKNIIIDICDEYPYLNVVFSGGVFQNRLLVSQLTQALDKKNRKYYMQDKTPINDGGIALGQAYHAHYIQRIKIGK